MARYYTTSALERMLLEKKGELIQARLQFQKGLAPQAEVARLDTAVADLEARLAEARDTELLENSAANHANMKVEIDEAQFWFRRFFTSLAIGNAGAFAALAAGVLQSDQRAAIAKIVLVPMICFASGLVSAGLLPFAFFVRGSLTDRFWWNRSAERFGDEDEWVSDENRPDYEAYAKKRIAQTGAVGRFVIFVLGLLSALLFGSALVTSLMSVAGIAATAAPPAKALSASPRPLSASPKAAATPKVQHPQPLSPSNR